MKPETLLNNNRQWVSDIKEANPRFFDELAQGQSPESLWIGCADSRIPPSQVVGAGPGELFVHRNIANMVVHTDLNCLSVLQYAVDHLGVKNVVVCGHYGCGGVKASMEQADHGIIDNWLRHIQDVYREHRETLEALSDHNARFRKLCELNVAAQVRNVANTPVVQQAWQRGQQLTVHGWIFELADGHIYDLGVSQNGAK